jgi:glycosyltransferase involved in cell wall biosynthesis
VTSDRGYVVITSARDEAENIGRTIDAMRRQTRAPELWVVVDDGSSDRTGAILADHLDDLPWLRVIVPAEVRPRSYASKAAALADAYRLAATVDHGVVAQLDADIELPPDYYERCLARLAADPRLGITGGVVVECVDERRRRQRSSAVSVAGAVQVFRRSCWQAVGCGYLPLEGGGEDAAAEVLARAHGFDVAAITDLPVLHHGRILGGARSDLEARVRRGRLHWQLGYRPAFQLASAAWRLGEPPFVLGSLATLGGYAAAAVRGLPRTPPPSVVAALRDEQRQRLREVVRRPASKAMPSAATSVAV